MDYGPLQIYPPGFLGFLQLKSAGKNPSLIPDTLQPTLDLLNWYYQAQMVDYRQAFSQTGVAITVGISVANGITGNTFWSPNAVVVPDKEDWFVQEYSIQTSAHAATDISQLQCMYLTPAAGGSNPYVVGDASPLITGVAGGNRGNGAFARGFYVPAGAQLGFRLLVNETATTISYLGFVRLVRLPH